MGNKDIKNIVTNQFNIARTVLDNFLSDEENLAKVSEIAVKISDCLSNQCKIISFGNGGSMCDAMHFAEELTGRFREDREPLAAISISDPSHITCVGNDYGFEHIFSRYITAHGKKGDIALGLSTSGNSPNVINAFKAAKESGVFTIALTGRNGGACAAMADLNLTVEAETSDRIQEIHIKILHIAIDAVENILFRDKI